MANNYTTIPAIIPGNLTVAGKLTVQGNELRVGAAPPYLRLYNVPLDTGLLSFNLQSDGVTRDDNTRSGLWLAFNGAIQALSTKTVDLAVNQWFSDPLRAFWWDHVTRSVSGVTGVQTVASKTIWGNQLGQAGGIRLLVEGSTITSASGTMGLGINWGGTPYTFFTVPSSQNVWYRMEVYIANRSTTNAQLIGWHWGYAPAVVGLSAANATADTTVNQTLAITANPSDTASSAQVARIEADFIAHNSAI